ncbi:hypothetical protein DICPUDRAFT_152315 [Dictyostelium purpureum]|uniref:Tafazzin family protein n=1 Tax=Dictyostelium purpureum TaxID=5786 RepID=F0ZL18_DICPU|nr:uncharacterized protein DICPUDRAFT_152315 [Dictyostelium purpureum]EGC35381.1 hypothetical protein DICPUDRAFT_152315 [Dictyostelium purpureum]|eukprot:XP_003288119.1 hypothetical protein DICPUDRAFT_152315 [Dictyostelium purpureum]
MMIIPEPGFLSKVVFFFVGGACKTWIKFNKVSTSGVDRLVKEIDKTHLERRPMITIANHISNLDDPLIWGVLPNRILMNSANMRWTLGASNILFTNWFYSTFFTLGKCIKIVRGDGIYQEGMDESIERLCEGQWLHIFPEGRVSQQQQLLYFKWGLGRLVGECFRKTGKVPLILPIYHKGMEQSMPLDKPPIPRIGKTLDIQVGESIRCEETIENYLKDHNITDPKTFFNSDKKRKDFYRTITLYIEDQYQLNVPLPNRGRFSHPKPLPPLSDIVDQMIEQATDKTSINLNKVDNNNNNNKKNN